MEIQNVDGYTFQIDVQRTIAIVTNAQIEKALRIKLADEVKGVGFSASTKMTNLGAEQWKKETGLLSLWELGCVNTASDNIVMMPLRADADSITAYFTSIEGRFTIKDQVAYYKADANYFNKVGVLPALSTNVMGSYSPSQNQLNIVAFLFNPDDSLYVNSVQNNTDPYGGDVTNIFNGGLVPNEGIFLPFYEFESSSAAQELEPGASIRHEQATFHFEGSFEALNEIAVRVLGVDLGEIPVF